MFIFGSCSFAHKRKKAAKKSSICLIKYYETQKNACVGWVSERFRMLSSCLLLNSGFYATKNCSRKKARKKNEKKRSLSKFYRWMRRKICILGLIVSDVKLHFRTSVSKQFKTIISSDIIEETFLARYCYLVLRL